MTAASPVYNPRPNAPDFTLNCICCRGDIRIRMRYNAYEEKMQYVTPRIHSCRCGARILLYRFNSLLLHPDLRLFNDGEVIYRHLGAYQIIDELDYCHRHDSWKFYDLYKMPFGSRFPGKTPHLL